MYDDLYSHREPGNRPGSNELAVRAHVAQSLVSGFFNGKKNISWETCRALVEALDGDPAVWGPLWRETDQRYRLGLRLGEFAPLPGDGGTGSRIPIADRSVADWAGHSHLPTLRVLRAVAAAFAVVGGIAALTLYTFLLGHLRYGRYADAGLMIAALAGWWWHRTRKSNTSERGRRGLLKKVLSRAQTIAAWADVGLYLPPAFTVPPRLPASARKKAGLTGETFRGTARELYERAGEDLVLLGEPGLGKTTQLARLTCGLAAEALREGHDRAVGGAVPVLLNLSSYQGEPLEEWLVTATNETYDVDKALVRGWLQRDLLVPLLDGLDQVTATHRQECARQIRQFRQRCSGIAIGCRSRDYRLARAIRATLYAELDPPDDDQVQAYLSSSFEALSAVREALEADRSWWKLLRSPLMLNIIYHAFGEHLARPSQAWSARDVFGQGSDEQRQGRIFDAYVGRMLTYRTTSYTAQQTIGWLTWLARTLTRQREETLYVERLQPEILADSVAERKVRNIVVPARILLGVGMSFAWLFVSGLPVPWVLVILIIIAGTVGPIISARKKEGPNAPVIRPVDRIDWRLSPRHLAKAAWTAGVAFTGALWIAWPYVGWNLRLVAGFGVGFTAAYLMVVGDPGASESPLIPNRPIRRSGFHALITQAYWTFVVVTSALVTGPLFRIEVGKSEAAAFVMMVCIGAGAGILPIAVINYGGGAFLQHWTLRWLLYRSGDAPLRYIRFLHDAEGRILIRRVGSGFVFPHRLLQEHLNTSPQILLERLGLHETAHTAPFKESPRENDVGVLLYSAGFSPLSLVVLLRLGRGCGRAARFRLAAAGVVFLWSPFMILSFFSSQGRESWDVAHRPLAAQHEEIMRLRP